MTDRQRKSPLSQENITMTAYFIKLSEEQDDYDKGKISCHPGRKFFFTVATVLILLATFRLWLITHLVTAPGNLKMY